MELLTNKEVKAMKEYNCDLCGGKIKENETYRYQSSVQDGAIGNFRCHRYCYALSSKYEMIKISEDGVGPEIFEEVIYENYITEFCDDGSTVPDMALKLFKKIVEL